MKGVWVKSAAKYRLCRCRCRCKINNDEGKELRLRPLLSSMAFWLPWPPFSPLTPIRLSHPFGPSLLPCSAQPSASPKLLAVSGSFSASEMASDVHPTASPAELQSHRRILALGLTERFLVKETQADGYKMPSFLHSCLLFSVVLDNLNAYSRQSIFHGYL